LVHLNILLVPPKSLPCSCYFPDLLGHQRLDRNDGGTAPGSLARRCGRHTGRKQKLLDVGSCHKTDAGIPDSLHHQPRGMLQHSCWRFSIHHLPYSFPFQLPQCPSLAEGHGHSAVSDNEELDRLNQEFDAEDNDQHHILRIFSRHRCFHQPCSVNEQAQQIVGSTTI